MNGAEKKRDITHRVPEHLVEPFLQTVRDFFTNARGGYTPAQRAAEIRAQDKDAGLDALAQLVELATHSDTGQAGTIARFLAGLYNGRDFPFDLTDLRGLDADLFEQCLAVLRLDNNPSVEVHRYIPNGDKVFRQMLQDWNLVPHPAPPPASGEDYNVDYVTHGFSPGNRSVTLHVRFEHDAAAAPATLLHVTAADCERMTRDLLDIHLREWRPGARPLDAGPNEQRPYWLPK